MDKQRSEAQNDAQQPPTGDERTMPKTESTSEYEGAETREPTSNPGEATKTETSSSSGE